jgi:small-conductance mechanosensitive channel
MARFRIETRRVRTRAAGVAPPEAVRNGKTLKRKFAVTIVAGTGAVIALGLSSTLGAVHGGALHQKLFALLGALLFFGLAVVAVRSMAGTFGSFVSVRAGRAGGAAVRVVTAFVGYVIVVFVGLGLLDVPVQHLLLGGALSGVVVGIAAQQALGNVFAGLVLLIARPFSLDERVRVRAGALGGIFDGVIRGMTLAYVTIETDDGLVNVPNSAMLAAAVGPAPQEETADLAVARAGAPPVVQAGTEHLVQRTVLRRAIRPRATSHRSTPST